MMTLLLSLSALAAPNQLPHQGRMLDGAGVPLTGAQVVTFSLHDAEFGGSELWTETQSLTFNGDGFYNTDLGLDIANPISDATLDSAALWLQVEVSGNTTDRIRVGSVAYARRAGSVIGGVADVSTLMIDGVPVQGLETLSCSADQIPLFDGSNWVCTAAASATVAWDDVTGRPLDLVDGDDDTLGLLTCGVDQIVKHNGTTWTCASDSVLDESAVDAFVADNGYAMDADIATVGKTGDYDDLSNLPTLFSGDYDDLSNLPTLFSGSYDDLSNLPTLFSGDYNDLSNLPTLFSGDYADLTGQPALFSGDWSDLANVPGDIADGDHDTLGALSGCNANEVATYDGSSWTCGPIDAAAISGTLNLDGVSTSGLVTLGDDGSTCGPSNVGSIRWTGDNFEGCTNNGWTVFLASTPDGSTPSNATLSCNQLHTDQPTLPSGTYWLRPGTSPAFQAYCDMTTDGGGWTLIVRNDQTTTFTNFNRNWNAYRDGFGNVDTQQLGWLGNQRIHELTQLAQTTFQVRNDVRTHTYEDWNIGNEASNWVMTFNTSGSPQSNDGGQFANHNNRQFSTTDGGPEPSCANTYQTGWWFNGCYWMTHAGTDGGQVYWRNPSGSPEYVTWIEFWLK